MALLILGRPAQGWDGEGHKVVARIAARHLSAVARGRVAALLEVEDSPEAVADAMATASVWADEVKGDTGTGSWHYIDLTLQDNRTNLRERCADNDCVVARVGLFAAQLKANDPEADTRFSDEDALRFLVHLVGDVHQPLHAISNADRGGNCEVLEDSVDGAKNLHALWDGPLVSRMGQDDAALAEELEGEIGSMAEGEAADFSAGTVEDWAWESHRLGMVNVYKKFEIAKQEIAFPLSCADAPEEILETHPQVDEEYLDAMAPVVRAQLEKAGLRLAKTLNGVLGE